MSRYFEIKQELEECMCPVCFGTGESNDAEPGDIRYDTWECSHCNGTGLNPDYEISVDFYKVK